MVLEVLSWLAEEERVKIRKRQEDGIAVAKKNGVKFGRPKVSINEKFKEIYIYSGKEER